MENTVPKPPLESFPAWQRSRELNKVVNNAMKKQSSRESEFFNPRSPLTAQSAGIMHDISELYVLAGDRRAEGMCRRITESLSRLKSHAYLEFDTEKLKKAQFEEVLTAIRGLDAEMKTVKDALAEYGAQTDDEDEDDEI
ncbi:MAG: hypothetical protein LLG37_01675 [Spirochaetia bacterium]|nr:hypothetical protein [Spirochaetia bacterium]